MRVPSDRDLKLGALPGELENKCSKMFTPIYDAMESLGIQSDYLSTMEESEQLMLTSDIGLRGVNMSRIGCIIDEAQNADVDTLKLILTRFHDDCHVILCGDSLQNDNKRRKEAFEAYGEYMSEPEWGNKVTLTKNFRGKLSQHAERFGGTE